MDRNENQVGRSEELIWNSASNCRFFLGEPAATSRLPRPAHSKRRVSREDVILSGPYCRAIATLARTRFSSSVSAISLPEISTVTSLIVPVNSNGGP